MGNRLLPGLREAVARPVAATSFLLVLSLCVLGACEGSHEASRTGSGNRSTDIADRSITVTVWDTVLQIGGELSDEVLLRPRLVAGGTGMVAAFDFGDRRVKAFDSLGARWSTGGEGGGPGEFRAAFDISIAEDGLTWVVDPDLNRITVISARGTVDTSYHLATERVSSVVPLGSGAWALTTDPDRFLVAVADESVGAPFPLAELRDLPWFMRQPVADHGAADDWAAVFPHGDLLLSFRGTELRCEGRLLAARGFDRNAPPDSPFTVAGIAVWDEIASVLADGGGPERLRLLDRYRIDDCRYVDTWHLPARASAVADMGGAVVIEVEDPSPHILVLRPRNSPRR